MISQRQSTAVNHTLPLSSVGPALVSSVRILEDKFTDWEYTIDVTTDNVEVSLRYPGEGSESGKNFIGACGRNHPWIVHAYEVWTALSSVCNSAGEKLPDESESTIHCSYSVERLGEQFAVLSSGSYPIRRVRIGKGSSRVGVLLSLDGGPTVEVLLNKSLSGIHEALSKAITAIDGSSFH